MLGASCLAGATSIRATGVFMAPVLGWIIAFGTPARVIDQVSAWYPQFDIRLTLV